MQNYRNADVYTRTWGDLVDLDTERTLQLGPGEATKAGVGIWTPQTKEVDGETVVDTEKPAVVGPLPADFEDAYLKPVAASKSTTKGATTTTTAEADAEAESTKE